MANDVLIFAELRGGEPSTGTWEAIAAGQKLAADLGVEARAVVFGHEIGAIAETIAGKRLGEVIAIDHAKLAVYTPDGAAAALAAAIGDVDPSWVVLSHTYQTRDFAPKVAVRLGGVMLGDLVGYRVEGDAVVFVRQIFQGKISADVTAEGSRPYLASFQAGAFRPDAAASGDVQAPIRSLAVDLDAVEIRWTTEERFKEAKAAVDLTAAARIVAVGRGIKSEENLELARSLAAALDAELGASRPICDSGWLPMDRQIGSSGQTVAPSLYVAVGISGAIQHVVGMKNAGTIVAINKDKEAPIFDLADVGAVGDLFEIVPALIKKLGA
jgi:electron transfer flavoprotein alpha subunit